MGVTSSGDQTGIGSRLSRRARNAYSVIKNNSIAFSRRNFW
ncbi:BnaA02g24070D [Brassica napus]|uniref:BnaA02g24070D protein n=1 Tax=Brassica napus TaxID=3708 RepID=A0A078GNX2_BRANA|nr:BnaA02g24070D [Brassica napus]